MFQYSSFLFYAHKKIFFFIKITENMSLQRSSRGPRVARQHDLRGPEDPVYLSQN